MSGHFLARPSEQNDWLSQATVLHPVTVERGDGDATTPVGCSLLAVLRAATAAAPRSKSPVFQRIRPKTTRRRRLIEELEAEKREVEESYEESQAQIAKLEAAIAERDDKIARLCKEVAEEKQLRQTDAEAVAARAEQIRTWVGTKVTELEQENKRLQESLRQAVSGSKNPISPTSHGYDSVRQSFHEYDYLPQFTLTGSSDAHEYEEPDDEFKRRFYSTTPPAAPQHGVHPQPVPPRRESAGAIHKLSPKHIVPAISPLPAPDFRALEPGRPERPPTPDLALLSPGASPLPARHQNHFIFGNFEQLKKSRSESDLLDDSALMSPLSPSDRNKRSNPEIAQLQTRPSKKPRPLPRRLANGNVSVRKTSEPPEPGSVLKPAIIPRRRAITDGDLLLGPLSREREDEFARFSHVSDPYARVKKRSKSEDNSTVVQASAGVPIPDRPKKNIYYQLETPLEEVPTGSSPEKEADTAEIRSRSPLRFASASSEAASPPPSPGFLQPLSAFTSVNTLPRGGGTWSRESCALQHDYSNIEVRPDHHTNSNGLSNGGGGVMMEHQSLLPVSSSDSALGTLDKPSNVNGGDKVMPAGSPPAVGSTKPELPKPQRKPPPPPVLPKKPLRSNGLAAIPASVPVISHMLGADEMDDAPLFETVPRGNSVGVRPTKKRPLPASVNNAGFLASSEDEREDSRQGGILTCDNTGLYSNAKFEPSRMSALSTSAPVSSAMPMGEHEANAKRSRIHNLAKQHKMHRSFHADNAFADPLVSGSPPAGRSRAQPKVLSDGSLDEPVLQKADLEHQGYLTKQGSKGKAWKRRWFALEGGDLTYYKLREDCGRRKPRGRLPLGELQAVSRDEDLTLQITTTSKMYSLTADSSFEADAWLKVFQNILRTSLGKRALEKVPTLLRPEYQGWVTRIQNGRAKRCWAVIVREMLLFYLSQDRDEDPFADVCLEECSLGVGSNTSNEESSRFRSQLSSPLPEKFTITLFSNRDGATSPTQPQTSLTVSGKDEKSKWLYHLTMSCKGFDETDTEKIVSMLMDKHHQMLSDFEGDSKVWWKHPVLSYSSKLITQPLTTLMTDELGQKAVGLFKNIQLFCEVKVEQRGIEYHIAHVMSLLKDIFSEPGLLDEVYCQLIRQSHNHPIPNGVQVQQCWRLLIILVACGLPKAKKFNWYLQRHIQHHLDYDGDVAVLAASCQRLLKRVHSNGPRALLPSRLELHCLLLGDMSQTRPVMLPVELMDGTKYAVECDALSLVQEVTDNLSQRLGLRDTLWSGFALFTTQPGCNDQEEYLKPATKICDAVQRVEKEALKDFRNGRLAPEKLWRLVFRNRLYFKGLSNQETDMEKKLLLFQIHEDVVKGRFPGNEEFAIDMMAHVMQVAQGPCPAGLNSHQRQGALTYCVNNFYPKRLLEESTKTEIQRLTQRLWVKWDGLRRTARDECLAAYLRMVRRWPFCSAVFFPCLVRGVDTSSFLLAIQEDSVSFLRTDSMDLDHCYRYDQLLTFGGCDGDLMLVIQHSTKKLSAAAARRNTPVSIGASTGAETLEKSGTRKVLLQMKPEDVTAATLTIASYIRTCELQQEALEAAATALGL
eukprot:scpid10924/ scgid5643/ Pleckstrin homology domain-containing family H member 1